MVGGHIVYQDQSATCFGRLDPADDNGYVGEVEGVFWWIALVVRDLDYYP